MASATRGPLIRTVRIEAITTMLAIPTEQKHLYRDGHDVPVVIEVKRHKVRATLAVTSGGEFVIPDWIRITLPELAKDQGGVQDANVYLSTRPIWYVEGAQDDAARRIAARFQARPLWDRLTAVEREAVALRWVAEKLKLLQ